MEYIIILAIAFVLTVVIVYIRSMRDIIILNKGYTTNGFEVLDANEEYTLLNHIELDVRILLPTPTRIQYKLFNQVLKESYDLILEKADKHQDEVIR
jgi:hypothetical protein